MHLYCFSIADLDTRDKIERCEFYGVDRLQVCLINSKKISTCSVKYGWNLDQTH